MFNFNIITSIERKEGPNKFMYCETELCIFWRPIFFRIITEMSANYFFFEKEGSTGPRRAYVDKWGILAHLHPLWLEG